MGLCARGDKRFRRAHRRSAHQARVQRSLALVYAAEMSSDPRYWVLCARHDFSSEDVARVLDSKPYEAKAEGPQNVVIQYTRSSDQRSFVLEVVFEHDNHAEEILDLLSPEIDQRKDAEQIRACTRSLIIYWDREDWTEVWDSAQTIDQRIREALGPTWTYDPNGLEWIGPDEEP